MDQADEKIDKYFRAYSAFGDHEAHLPPRADGRYEVEPKACPRGGNDGRFTSLSPCCAAVIVRADASLVCKVDIRLGLARQCFDLWKFLLQPLLHRLGVLLVGTPHRPLRAQPQLVQKPADRATAKSNPVFVMNQAHHHGGRPQGKGKLQLQRVLIGDRVVEPTQCGAAKLPRPPTPLAGIQCVPSTLPVPATIRRAPGAIPP